MPMFRNMSFPCTVGTYLLLFLIWKLAVLVFTVLVIQFLTAWFGGQGISWVLSGIVLAVSFGLWFFLPDYLMVKLFRYLNPIGLLDVKQIIGFILLLGTALVGEREYFTWKIILPTRKKKRLWKHLFSYGFHKVVVCQKVWCVYVVLIVTSVMTIHTGKEHIGVKEYYYEKYLTEYEGDYTENKVASIGKYDERMHT